MTDEDAPVLEAATYDRWFDTRWGGYAFRVERDALVQALGPLDGQRLAEIGCGTGRFTAAFEAAGAQVTRLERAGRLVPGLGAFQIAVVDLPGRPAGR